MPGQEELLEYIFQNCDDVNDYEKTVYNPEFILQKHAEQ